MMSVKKLILPLLAWFALLVLAGCGGGGTSATPAGNGTLRVSLTDAPSCGYDMVNVTISKVRVHASSSAADADPGWSEIVLSPARRIDLLTLTNGVLSELGQTPLGAGRYQQLRLVLASNDTTSPLANAVLPNGATQEIALATPSAQQSGLKMNADIGIEVDKIADFVIDFDACKSVVRAGNSSNYLLKPVVRVTPLYVSGISGYLPTAVATGSTMVSLQQSGVVVKATVPDASGKFLLPAAPGFYDLVIRATGRATTVVTGVPVSAQTVTALNTAANPLPLASAASGTVSGTVTGLTTPVDASVTAHQTLAGGQTIEVVGGQVEADSGAYSYALPAAAPQVAAYVAPPAALNFVADAAVGNTYLLRALSGSTARNAGPIIVISGVTMVNHFAF